MSPAKPVIGLTPERVDRFWAKVNRGGPSDCWEWMAWRAANGYGLFTLGRIKYWAHRIAYVLTNGEPPAGLDLDHLCRNRACVNPTHLEPVTRQENLRRGVGHGSETHCPSGHSYNDAYRDPSGSRKCRTCTRQRLRARYQNDPVFRAAKKASARRSHQRRSATRTAA